MDEVRNIDEFENYDAYEIIIKTKSDIIATIRQNITDGEVMDDIINITSGIMLSKFILFIIGLIITIIIIFVRWLIQK